MSRDKAAAPLLLLMLVLVCFAFLGDTDVVSMEGIVADGARHMLRTGDWAVPHLYGEIYAYKPPMVYWLVASSFGVTGAETEWSLRLPVAFSAFVAAWMMYFTLRRLLDRGAAASCVLASVSGLLVIQKIQMAEFDMPLASGLMVATAAACVTIARQRSSVAMWSLVYGALAFALLSKGLPALALYLPGLLIAAFLLGSMRLLRDWRHWLGFACFAVPVGTWIWVAVESDGWAAFEQIFAEASSRGLQWAPRDIGLTLLKPLIVVLICLPWSLVLPACRIRTRERVFSQSVGRLLRAATVFAVSGTLVLMLTPTQNVRYLLPMCGPMGMIAGVGISQLPRLESAKGRGLVFRAIVVVTAAAILGVFVAMWVLGDFSVQWRRHLVLGAAAGAAILVLCCVRKDASSGVFRLALCVTLCFWAVDRCVVRPSRAETRSMRSIAAAFDTLIPREQAVWVDTVDSYSSLFFYLGRPVSVFDSQQTAPTAGAYAVLTEPQLDATAPRRQVRSLLAIENRGRVLVLCRYSSGAD